MIIERRTVTIDNGGSELRVLQNSNNKEMFKVSKEVAKISSSNFRIKDGVDPFEIISIEESSKKDLAGTYVVGGTRYMYTGTDMLTDNQKAKTDSENWYLQIILGIAIDAMHGLRSKEVKSPNLEFEYSFVTLIPVKEHFGSDDCAAKLKSTLEGTYQVSFPALAGPNKIKFSLKKKDTGVVPEGVVALTAIGPDIKPNDFTLIMDMGHISLDLAICRGKQPIANAVMSSPTAGGTLIKLVRNVVNSKGLIADDESCVKALLQGTISIGAREVDIRDEIDTVKKEFIINRIKPTVLMQLELAGLNAATVTRIIPIGALFNTIEGDKLPLLDCIIKECGLENAEVVKVAEDLRYVNIKVAGEYADKLASKAGN